MGVCIWAFWFCLSSRSCCSSFRVIHYEQGGTCRAFSEISRRILERADSEDQEDCISSFVKKVKEVHSIKWKKVGNEKQFKFNHSVEARFDSAIFAIEKKKLDKAKKELEEGKKLLSERQKLIKMADRSECGWTTVSAYVTDDLEDTPDDERRISNAEKSANKALDSKREKSRVNSGSANYTFNHASFSHVSNFSFEKPHFCSDLSSGEEPASLMDRKGIG